LQAKRLIPLLDRVLVRRRLRRAAACITLWQSVLSSIMATFAGALLRRRWILRHHHGTGCGCRLCSPRAL
jgi:hypothetical protein